MNRFVPLFALILLSFLLIFNTNAGADELKLIRVNPSGQDVPDERQIIFQFDKPVVPIGRMERTSAEIPITITPDPVCEWRWINTSSLACQLTEANKLKSSTKYLIKVEADFTAIDGSKLSQSSEYSFVTQRPVIKYTWFNTWKAPGWPVLMASFDQKVDLNTLAEHLYFESSSGQRFNLKVKPAKSYPENYIVIRPISELPENTHFTLNVEPGVLSLEQGSEQGVDSRKIVEFDTFGKFEFLGIRCYDNDQNSITLKVTENNSSRCDPTSPVDLLFSSPVIIEELQKGLKVTPDLAGGRADLDPWEHIYSSSSLSQPHTAGSEYAVTIPIILKALDTYELKASATEIKDEFGRELVDGLNFKFNTDHRPAKYVYESSLAVLEKEAKTNIPIFVTNLDKVNLSYNALTTENVIQSAEKTISLDNIKDIAYLKPIDLREILGGRSGVLWGNLNTTPSTSKEGARWFFNQVTPYQVHAKLGHYNSLIWVTSLADGQPIEGANIEIISGSLTGLTANRTIKATGNTNASGIAVLPGLEKIDPELNLLNKWDYVDQRLFVRVQKGEQLAILPIHYEFSAYSYGTYADNTKKYGHVKAWGTTAQGVYRAGDSIDFKLYVRNQNTNTFSAAPAGKYKLEVYDPLGKVVSTVEDLKLNEFGAYDGILRLSQSSAVGWYRFELSSNFTEYKWQALNVLVSDFTPSPFKVSNELNGKIFETDQEITVSTAAKLHSGGPYLEAPTRITATLSGATFHPIADYSFEDQERAYFYPRSVYTSNKELDDLGELDENFAIADENIPNYGNIVVESAVRDDRGKYVATTASAKFYSRDRFVGLKLDSWVIEKGKPSKIELVVVDQEGKNQTGSNVEVVVERLDVKASRVKGAGNAYLTKYIEEWLEEDRCKIFSTEQAQACTFIPKGIGEYRINATVTDTKGREQKSSIWRWSIGQGQTLWSSDTENKLEIVAEKEDYKLGEKARFLIKNPYPGAKALFTIERYGVLKSWTAELKNSSEIIEFEIEKDYLPGIYFSAVVMSPRVDDAPVEGDVDLGKPTFRMGYVKIATSDEAKRIDVSVTAEKETYKPRDEVIVDLKLTSKDIAAGDVELAVAVLDEAVFDLVQGGSNYFDPYRGFYKLDPLDVSNYNILKQLIGLRKFEKKGANAGGDGGKSNENRNIFKFVSYWNPSIRFDNTGKARIKFTAPDNLTGWRVLALAVNKTDRLGLGQGNFKVNKSTEIRPANPNQVIEGDSFIAKFTVMNRTDKARNLKVTLSANGAVESEKTVTVQIDAEPYKRQLVSIPITSATAGKIIINASAEDVIDRDGLTVEVPVNKKAVLQAAANYQTTTEDQISDIIKFPDNMREDVGRVSVVLSPTVISSLVGAFEYLRDYPYLCWEQQITKAVAAMQYLALKQYLPQTFMWPDAEKIIADALLKAQEHQAPNGGMVFYIAKDEYVSPYLSAYTAIAFNWLRKAGYEIPKTVEANLQSYLIEFLRKDVVPDFYSEGMASSVRAVALAALAEQNKVTIDDISRHQKNLGQMSLFAKSYLLQAIGLTKGANQQNIAQQIVDNIISHANESGGKYVFTETLDTRFARIMESSSRTNCAVLDAILNYPIKDESLKDVPFKMLRYLSQSREKKVHWQNTQENVFCLNAIVEYSKKYENEKPNYSFDVSIDNQKRGTGNFKSFREEAVEIDKPIASGDSGREIKTEINKKGVGRVYTATRLFYSPKNPGENSINSGIEVRREYSVERDGKFKILTEGEQVKQGELVRVDLFISLPTARNFVVVNDPIPGGLEPVNTDLATASTVDANKANYVFAEASFWYEKRDWLSYGVTFWSFYHKELRHDSARFYSEYLPKGNYHLSYAAQAIAPGKFVALPTHSEEMYDSDVFGETKATVLEVVE